MDRGVENEGVCQFMEAYRGHQRGSAIKGKSCHNVRIERYWVEVWNNVVNEFYDLFTYLESKNILDITDDNNIKILHCVFLPRINACLEQAQFQNNNHGLSTERHRSPNSLFITGVLDNINSECVAIRDLVGDAQPQQTGSESVQSSAENEVNEFNNYQSRLIESGLDVKQDLFNVPYGGDLYVKAKQIIENVL